jgi:pSer/pThr/pTyr-binding forkhead associated (FHA) protein
MEIRIPLGVGSRIIKTPLAQRFMSGIQFNVVKRGNNWVISHHPEAVNITRLNGQPLSQPTPLSDGDVISFGKTGQVPIKVGFRK